MKMARVKRIPVVTKLFLLGSMWVSWLTLQAQTPVEKFFLTMPVDELPVLPPDAREELVKLAHGGGEVVVANLFGMPSRLVRFNDTGIRINLTSSSWWEVRSLPTDTVPIFGVIHTFLKPVPASRIAFYTADWQPLPDVFRMPDLGDFLDVPDSVFYLTRKHWVNVLVPQHVVAHWDEYVEEIVLEVNLQGLSHEERNGAEHVFRPVRLRWNKGRWEPVSGSF